jgi:ABC-type lipoprotein release transport system permease subunit
MNLPLHIAIRYLFSPKSHNAINIVSLVSVLGVAVAVAAMVCVLSVYNGFQELLGNMYSSFDPQVKIRVVEGKTFQANTATFDPIRKDPSVAAFCEVLEENALVQYKNAQTSATIKGVADNFNRLSDIEKLMTAGNFTLHDANFNYAVVGVGLAGILGTGGSFIDPVTINAPKRIGSINLANPAASFTTIDILISGTFGINQPDYDNNLMLVPLAFARELFDYTDEVTAVEIRLKPGSDIDQCTSRFKKLLGKGYSVQGLAEQKADFYRINRIEKWMTYLILSFILLIALFNVIGSLSMLILEKKKDAITLSRLGANQQTIRRIFLMEGWLIAMIGAALGIVLGTGLCLLQQHFGLLKLGGGGNFIVDAYPVRLMVKDILLVVCTVLLVGIPSTWWPVQAYLRKNGKFLLLLPLFLLLTIQAKAQLPHGNSRPLPIGAEKASKLRSAVDYFVEMPSLDTDSARIIDDLPGNRIGGLRFAHTFFTDLSPENAGIVFHDAEGNRIWKVGIRSNGAYSLNVLFSQYELPDGACVFLYNPDRSVVLGPFTNENRPDGGEFSVAPVAGDELVVEYHEPAGSAISGKVRITEVNHDYRGLFRTSPRFNSLNMSCQPDVSCNPALDTISRSVCLLIVNGSMYCTGTLLNNTARDGKPYLLTASHCLNGNSSYGNRVVAFMNYQSPRCDRRIRGSEEFSLSGSVCRALNINVDFALLELSEMPPKDYRPYLAGWSISTNAAADKPYLSIHHPNGDTRKYCVDEDYMTMADWPSSGDSIKPGNHWYVSYWEQGHTWGGSSGCGLFDRNLRFRGGLTGGGSGGATGCSSYTDGDYFFRLDRAWNQFSTNSKQLKHWLDPISSNTLTLDGLDPYESNSVRRISNIQTTDTLEKVYAGSGWGSPFGHNSLQTIYFVEHFTVPDSSIVHGAYLLAARGTNNSSKPVYLLAYGGGDAPGDLLGKALLNPNYVDYVNGSFVTRYKSYFSNKENYVRFNKPVKVGKDFYIGYEISYPISAVEDSFYLYAAIRSDTTNTAFFKQNGSWHPYSQHPINPMHTSLWIEPVVEVDTTISKIDTGTVISALRPLVAWSDAESNLIVAFPDQWSGETTAEIFDLSGKRLQKALLNPPTGSIHVEDKSPRLLLIRLTNDNFSSTQKAMIGF